MLFLDWRNVIPGKSFKMLLLSLQHFLPSKNNLGIVPITFFVQSNHISIWHSIIPKCFLFKKSWFLCWSLGQDWITLKKSLNCLWRWGPQQFLSKVLHYISSRDKAMHWHVAKIYSVVYYQMNTMITIQTNNMLMNDKPLQILS